MKKSIMLLCAAVMSLSLTACKTTSVEPVETEKTTQAETTPAETTQAPEPSKVMEEPKETEMSEYDKSKQELLEYVDVAYTGLTAANAPMYFMAGNEGEFVALVLENADGKSYIKFIGSADIDEESGILTVTDSDNGYMFGFTAEKQSEGTFFLDCGNLGEAYLEAAEPSDVVDYIVDSFNTMEDVTDSFMEAVTTMNLMESIDVVYSGLTDADGWMYYLASSDGSFAALILENTEETGYIKFIGSTIIDQETGIQTVIDDQKGYTFGFIAEAQEDGSYFLDCGELGECYLELDELDVVMDYISTTFEDMEDVTDEFMNAYGH